MYYLIQVPSKLEEEALVPFGGQAIRRRKTEEHSTYPEWHWSQRAPAKPVLQMHWPVTSSQMLGAVPLTSQLHSATVGTALK